MNQKTKLTKDERIAKLEGIVKATLWMARRYAHGRASYAVGMYNDAARNAVALGLGRDSDGSVFAIDGLNDFGSPSMSGLSQEEYDEAVIGLNIVGITPVPSKFAATRLALSEARS